MPTTQASTSKRSVKLKKPTLTTKSKTSRSSTGKFVTPEQRLQMIAEAAYFLAEKRGFEPGNPEADWLCAETQIDKMLTNQ